MSNVDNAAGFGDASVSADRVDAGEIAVQMGSDNSLPSLLKRLVDDAVHLLRTEMRLALAELKENAARAGIGAGVLVAGGMLVQTASLVLLAGIVSWLAESVGTTAACFIVGGVLLVAGGIAIATGLKRLKTAELAPNRAIANVKRDVETLKGD